MTPEEKMTAAKNLIGDAVAESQLTEGEVFSVFVDCIFYLLSTKKADKDLMQEAIDKLSKCIRSIPKSEETH